MTEKIFKIPKFRIEHQGQEQKLRVYFFQVEDYFIEKGAIVFVIFKIFHLEIFSHLFSGLKI